MTRAQKRPLTEASNLHDKRAPVDIQETGRTTKRAKPTRTKSTSKAVATTVSKAPSKTNAKAVSKPKAAPKIKAAPRPKATPKTKINPDPNPNPKARVNITSPQSSPPSNPHATLAGLPAELRLHIYSFLRDADLIHVHYHPATETSHQHFTWTPCRGTDPSNHLLCANPKWSGTCVEEERCTYNTVTPSEPRGFYALAASCRSLRDEIIGLLRRCEGVSIDPNALKPWLQYMEQRAPRHLEQLRRVTLAGSVGSFSYAIGRPMDCTNLRNMVPRLEALAVQTQDQLSTWVRTSRGPDVFVRKDFWKIWYVTRSLMGFETDIEITAEIMVHWNPRRISIHMCNPDVVEQLISVRLKRPVLETAGELNDLGYLVWEDEDVQVEVIQPRHVGAPKQNAKWRNWWKTKELRY
jgi:hypothetical protein